MKHLVPRLRHPATAIAALALFVALGGGAAAYASGLISGSQIKNHSIAEKKLTKSAITALRGQRGARGPAGPTGATGATGPQGIQPNIAARIYNSTDETVPLQIAGGPVMRLSFDRVSFDTAGLFDPAHPTRLTAPVTGIYLISTNVSWQVTLSPSGLNRAVYLYVNGHAISVDQRPPAQETRQVVTTIYRLNAGDEVEVGVGQDEATTLIADAVGDYAPSLEMAWIAPG